MSLVLSFKTWKLNSDVITSFCAISRIWSWHSISRSVENCVFSWCTCIFGTWKFDALAICGVVVSSPLANKVRFSFVLRGRKDYGMSAWTPLVLIIGLKPNASPLVWSTYLVAETLGATLASCAESKKGKKKMAIFGVRLELCALERTYSPTMASCGRP
jgi:hypothetical protein